LRCDANGTELVDRCPDNSLTNAAHRNPRVLVVTRAQAEKVVPATWTDSLSDVCSPASLSCADREELAGGGHFGLEWRARVRKRRSALSML